MRYLKSIFESNDKYYQKLSEKEYDKLKYNLRYLELFDTYDSGDTLIRDENKEPFSKKEVDFFNKISRNPVWEGDKITRTFDNSWNVKLTLKGIDVSITRLKDEYFLVNWDMNVNSLYKCDQLEGLKKLMEDKGVL